MSLDSAPVAELRRRWQEDRQRVEALHRQGADGLTVAHAIAAAVEGVVLQAYAAAGPPTNGGHALAAVGGFGRSEMAPHSDVDLLFLFERERDQSPDLVSAVLHPLWDLHFDVGHSSRTVAQAVALARQDLEVCTSLLDARLLAGNERLFARFRERLYGRLPRAALSRLQAWRGRRLENRDSVQLLEPHLKDSPGGLRDLQAVGWALQLSSATPEVGPLWPRHLDAEDRATLEAAARFLWRVRHELHLLTGRRRDLLEHELKPRVAAGLGYRDQDSELAAEAFMREYYLHARGVWRVAELTLERLSRRVRSAHRSLALERGVLAVDGEIVLVDPEAWLAEDPVRLLRLFHLAQVKNLRLGEPVLRAVRAALPLIDDGLRANPEARELFLRILRRRHRVAATLRAMHDLGLLGAYLPEFGELTCLVQYDVYHIYTVDEHTLVAIEALERLGTGETPSPLRGLLLGFERRDLLVLAVLLHDIGKSKRQEHVSCGVRITREVCRRLGLADEDARFLLFAVEHHQEMVILSQRRDLDDYRMIAGFAALFPEMAWLQALYLLSYADLSAVARDAWTDWQAALLWELYHKTAEQLQSGMATLEQKEHGRHLLEVHLREVSGTWPALKVVAFQEHVQQLPPRYLLAYGRSEIERHLALIGRLTPDRLFEVEFVERPSWTEVLVCTRDQRQLLAKICGVLAANDVDIRRADVNTRDDEVVLDLFQVTDVDGSPALPDWKQERVRLRLEEVIGRKLKARELLDRYSAHWERRKEQKRASGRPGEIQIENQVSDRYTVIDVEVQDDVGLLYTITYGLAELELNIHMAIVNTVAGRARDAFYVVDGRGEKIVNYEVLEEIRQRLLSELTT